jgi:uncharacterized protein
MLMSGLSGSGKSTTAGWVAQRLGAVQLRSDAVRKHLGGVALAQAGDAALYSLEMTQRTYDRLLSLGLLLAGQGYRVILDAKYDRMALRQPAIVQAQAAQIPLKILHCTAPVEVLRDRVQARRGDVSDATTEVLSQQHLEPFTAAELPLVLTVDTTLELGPQLAGL